MCTEVLGDVYHGSVLNRYELFVASVFALSPDWYRAMGIHVWIIYHRVFVMWFPLNLPVKCPVGPRINALDVYYVTTIHFSIFIYYCI